MFSVIPALNNAGNNKDKLGLLYQFLISCLLPLIVGLYYQIRYGEIVRSIEGYELSKKLNKDNSYLANKLSVISSLPLSKKLSELQVLADSGLIYDIKDLKTDNWTLIEQAINQKISQLKQLAIDTQTAHSVNKINMLTKIEYMLINGKLRI